MKTTQKLFNHTPQLGVAEQPVCHIHMPARYATYLYYKTSYIHGITLCLPLIPELHMWCSPFQGIVTVRVPCLSCMMSTYYISQTHHKLKVWKYTVHFKSWRQHCFAEVRFKVVTAVTMKNAVFWDVMACSLIENCQCFRWTQSTTLNMETHKFSPDYTDSHPRINVFLLMLSYIQNTECARHRKHYFVDFIIKNSIKSSVLTQLRFITITTPDINATRFSSESRDILISVFSDPKVLTIELTPKCIHSTLNPN